jgi:hypothetical protein
MTVARILANKGRSVVTTLPERTLQEVRPYVATATIA